MNKYAMERFYRVAGGSTGMKKYSIRNEETDILVLSNKFLKREMQEEIEKLRGIIKAYISRNPVFRSSFEPVECKSSRQIIKLMCLSGELTGTGPMASVAGAIVQVAGEKVFGEEESFFLENGGDIYARMKDSFIVGIYAGNSPFSLKIGLRFHGRKEPYGIATSSGTVGHSFSYGDADAVTVVSSSAAFADGSATHFGNMVKGTIDRETLEKEAAGFPFIEGLLVIRGSEMFAWGRIEITGI